MAQIGSAVVKFSADTANYSKGTQQAKKENKSFFDDLKSNFGKSSALGQSLKVLAGSGAIFALGKIASEFDELTAKVRDQATAVASGKATWGEFSAELLKSIPVVGKLGEGLSNLYSIASGEAQYLANIKEATEAQEHHIEQVKKLHEVLSKLKEDFEAKTPYSGVDAKIDEARKKAKAITDGEQQAAQKKLDELRGQLSTMSPTTTVSGGTGGAGVILPNLEYAKTLADIKTQEDAIAKAKEAQAKATKEINAQAIGARGAVFGQQEQERIKHEVEVQKNAQKYIGDGLKNFHDEQVKRSDEILQKNLADGRERIQQAEAEHRKLIEGAKKWAEENAKLTEKAATPLEKYQKAIGELRLRYAQGGINAQTFDRLRGQAFDDLRSESQKPIDVIARRQSGGTSAFSAPKEDEQTVQLKTIVEMFRPVVQKLTSDPVGALMSLIGGGNS